MTMDLRGPPTASTDLWGSAPTMMTMAMTMAMVVMALYGPSRSGRPCQTSSASSSASRLRLAALRQLMLPSAAPSRQRAALILPRLRHDPQPWEWPKGKERRRDACVGDTGLGWRLHWLHEVPSASTEARPAPAPSGALEVAILGIIIAGLCLR